MSGAHRTRGGASDLVLSLNGRLTYRQLDYWERNGWIVLSHPYGGSGSRRKITAAETAAIIDVLEATEQYRAIQARIRSGELFAEALARHQLEERLRRHAE